MVMVTPEGSQNGNTEEEAGGSTQHLLQTHLTNTECRTFQQVNPMKLVSIRAATVQFKVNFVSLKMCNIDVIEQQSPETQYQLNQLVSGELHYFKYGWHQREVLGSIKGKICWFLSLNCKRNT